MSGVEKDSPLQGGFFVQGRGGRDGCFDIP